MQNIRNARDWTYKGLATYVACALRREFEPTRFSSWKDPKRPDYSSDDLMTALGKFTYGVDCVRRWRQWRPKRVGDRMLNFLPSYLLPEGTLFEEVEEGVEWAAECVDLSTTEEERARRKREGLIANPLRRGSYRTNVVAMWTVRGTGLRRL